MTKNWIFFRGTNKIRENEIFRAHGIEFEKGKIYPVSDEVYEYVKAIKGFEKCRGLGAKEEIRFPKEGGVVDVKKPKPTKPKEDTGDKVVVQKVRKDEVKQENPQTR